MSIDEIRLRLANRLKSGASWFIWIAVLSIVNSVISMMGSDRSFIIGLGVTQVIDAVAKTTKAQTGSDLTVIAFVLDVIAAGVFFLFGVFARRKLPWVFVLGMVLYALDGLIFLLVRDWLSIGFHVFALYGIYQGLKACKLLLKLEQALEVKARAAGASLGAPL